MDLTLKNQGEPHQKVNEEQLEQPLLREKGEQQSSYEETKPQKTKKQKTIRKTFKGASQLAKLLPTGSVLVFEVLSPVLTHKGQCPTPQSHYLTLALIIFCTVSSFVLRFTDSIRDERGKVRYGFTTLSGIWIVDGTITLPPEEAVKYRIRFRDFFHGVVSVLVFVAVALFDQNVVKCFYPAPSEEEEQLLEVVPVAIGVACSLLFVWFPSERHGVSSPLSKQ